MNIYIFTHSVKIVTKHITSKKKEKKVNTRKINGSNNIFVFFFRWIFVIHIFMQIVYCHIYHNITNKIDTIFKKALHKLFIVISNFVCLY